MDEIEYKLKTNNSVLIVNAIDKLISSIKAKFKPAERQKFVLENEELKLLREKCSSKEVMVSLTACQGLLALVELGVLEIAHTMSTVVTLLPTAHNYAAIVSTMSGLLVLDLKSRLVPGEEYHCQFSLKSPQHPFITVLERNKEAEDDVFVQMEALCTHADYTVSSNSLELLRPVFQYVTCSPRRAPSPRPWRLLLSLPAGARGRGLLLACLTAQQICRADQIERAVAAYSAVSDAAADRRDGELAPALLPPLARLANQLLRYGRDPRPCYRLMERCLGAGGAGGAGAGAAAGLALLLLAENLPLASALYLHDTLALGLNIISHYEVPSVSVNAFVAQSLQWLHLPSHLTAAALKVAASILDLYRERTGEDTTLHIHNLMENKIFQSLVHTDSHLSVMTKLVSVWERLRDDEERLASWLHRIRATSDAVRVELLSFFYGLIMGRNCPEQVVIQLLSMVVDLVDYKKDIAVELLPILVYKIANDKSPAVKLECLRALPLMAKTKENVPTIVSILSKLKANKGVPTSFLIMLYASLAETQVRCFPYLQEILAEPGPGRPDDSKWEVDVARILAVRRMCQLRASSHGLELVPLVSSTLNRCGGAAGAAAAVGALQSVGRLWRRAALAAPSAWAALEPKLARDGRAPVQIQICKLLSEVPALQSGSPEFGRLAASAARRLWALAAAGAPDVARAACRALALYSTDLYTLRDVPEIYRKTVKLPASFCKTPADAARRPEDVLDYVPSEVWPEVFKYTNQVALDGVVFLARRLIEREVRGLRSGAYHVERGEPASYGHLPPASVLRGVMDAYRRQVSSPSFDCPPAVTQAMLEALSGEFSRPLPPIDVHFLTSELLGGEGRIAAIRLAAYQGKVSPSAKAIVENWILGIQSGHVEEEDIILFYTLLPTLTRYLPPNTLRIPLERTLSDAFAQISHTKAKKDYATHLIEETMANITAPINKKNEEVEEWSEEFEEEKLFDEEDSLFEKQLKLIRRCLECESIHDANRTLVSQLVEHYFDLIADNNVAWPTYVQTCCSLSSSHLERMTSPSGWWEVTGARVRRAAAVRAAVAARGDCAEPLAWLNEVIDAQAQQITEPAPARLLFPALLAAAGAGRRAWLLQLMARAQRAFTETEDQSAKLYLFEVFCLAVVTWSGHWAFEAEPGPPPHPARALPAAAPALLEHIDMGECTLQVLEWTAGTRRALRGPAAAWCARTLLALRHTAPCADHRLWARLESNFGKDLVTEA